MSVMAELRHDFMPKTPRILEHAGDLRAWLHEDNTMVLSWRIAPDQPVELECFNGEAQPKHKIEHIRMDETPEGELAMSAVLWHSMQKLLGTLFDPSDSGDDGEEVTHRLDGQGALTLAGDDLSLAYRMQCEHVAADGEEVLKEVEDEGEVPFVL